MAKNRSTGLSGWQLLSLIEKDDLPSAGLFLLGEEAYICSEIADLFKQKGYEVIKEDLGGAGPCADWEAHASSLGLFSNKKVLWSKISGNPSKWTRSAVARYENLQKNLCRDSLILLLQCSNKKLKVKAEELSLTEFSLSVSDSEKAHWLKRMAQKAGMPLSSASAHFLLSFDFDLLTLSQYVALWSLGGDFWAQRALGWNPGQKSPHRGAKGASYSTQPAFLWVDAVIEGRQAQAMKLLKELCAEGQEIIQLFALLAKTLRLLSLLQTEASLEGQAPFLIKKLKRQKIRIDLSQALDQWVEVDYAFKSSAQDPYALAERYISSISR